VPCTTLEKPSEQPCVIESRKLKIFFEKKNQTNPKALTKKGQTTHAALQMNKQNPQSINNQKQKK